MFVHREGVKPSSMDGVHDLRDHRSFVLSAFQNEQSGQIRVEMSSQVFEWS